MWHIPKRDALMLLRNGSAKLWCHDVPQGLHLWAENVLVECEVIEDCDLRTLEIL